MLVANKYNVQAFDQNKKIGRMASQFVKVLIVFVAVVL
jgi:hypothetical protein